LIIFNHKVKDLEPGQRLFLVPFGDVHYNAPDCDKERFHRLIKWATDQKKHGNKVRFVGMGDYNDPLSTSERDVIIGSKGGKGLHDTTKMLLDKIAKQVSDEFAQVMMPVQDDVIGLVEGHHYMEFMTDEFYTRCWTNTEYLCETMGWNYLGDVGLGRLELTHGLYLDLLVYHGKGNGGLSTRMKAAKDFPGAHIVLMGHDHQKVIGTDQGIILNGESPDGLASMKRYYVGTGSFLKGYHAGRKRGSYVEKALMPPNELGVAMIEIEVEKRNGKWRVDYHASI
jgi:hypothetical protein